MHRSVRWGEVLWCILSYASSMAPGMTVDWNIPVTVGLIHIKFYTRLWSPDGEAYWLRWSFPLVPPWIWDASFLVRCFNKYLVDFHHHLICPIILVYNTIAANLMTLQSKRCVRGLKPTTPHQLLRTEEGWGWVRGETSSWIWNKSSCPRCSISSEPVRSVWILLLTAV